MKNYSFSEIRRCTWNNTYGTREEKEKMIGKYFCQVFDENGQYVTYLIGDTYKEVVEEQDKQNRRLI